MINDYILARKMYEASVPEESRDVEVVNFMEAQYCANEINNNLSTLKYLKNQINNPITDLFNNECLAGIKPSRENNSKKAILIKLNLLLKYNNYLAAYLLDIKETLETKE